VGKVAVLGCGYGMGINKYIDTVYDWTGINLHDPNCAGCQAKLRGNKAEHEGCTGQRAVNTYRTVNAPIKELSGGRVRFRVKGQFLWAVLPSGRPLCYPLPKLVDTITPWGAEKQAVEISTTNSYTRKWERRTLYGGLIVENLTQAIARDVMADAMLRVEAAGYPTGGVSRWEPRRIPAAHVSHARVVWGITAQGERLGGKEIQEMSDWRSQPLGTSTNSSSSCLSCPSGLGDYSSR
jgi:hypothetical protein